MKRILDACDEDGVPHPHYEVRPGSVVVVFDRPNVVENVVDNVVENVVENNVTLAAYFNVTERTIQRDLKVLQEEGFLRHEGPDHGGRYVLLYS